MTDCPQCHRRLLSHASAKCNWCGMVIANTDYQAQAQAEREAYFAHQAQHDAQSLAQIEAAGINSYDPFLGPYASFPFQQPSRRPTTPRPLTYENQPQAVQTGMPAPGAWPIPANKNCENELPLQPVEDDRQEQLKQGRFQHLEL